MTEIAKTGIVANIAFCVGRVEFIVCRDMVKVECIERRFDVGSVWVCLLAGLTEIILKAQKVNSINIFFDACYVFMCLKICDVIPWTTFYPITGLLTLYLCDYSV